LAVDRVPNASDVVNREVRQILRSISRPAALRPHQPAVRHLETCGARIDTSDPQRAEITLLRLAIAVSVLAGLDDRLLRRAIHLRRRCSNPSPWRGPLVPASTMDATLTRAMGHSGVGQHCSRRRDPAWRPSWCLADCAPLARLLGEDVSLLRLTALEAARCLAKTLGRARLVFNLGM